MKYYIGKRQRTITENVRVLGNTKKHALELLNKDDGQIINQDDGSTVKAILSSVTIDTEARDKMLDLFKEYQKAKEEEARTPKLPEEFGKLIHEGLTKEPE